MRTQPQPDPQPDPRPEPGSIKAILGVALSMIVILGGLGFAACPVNAAPKPAPVGVPQRTAKDKVQNPNPSNKTKALPGKNGTVIQSTPSGSRTVLAGPWYTYTLAEDNQSSTGAKSDAIIGNPWKSSLESHTLWETAVCDSTPITGRNCIEVGWVKGTSCSITTDPCFFVGYWKNGVFQGWNGGADYYDYAPNTTIYAGISLAGAVGGSRHFRIQYSNGAWWIGYGTGANGSTWFNWVGYVDVSGWSTPFTTANVNQWFGEVVSTSRDQTLQCTDDLSNVNTTTTAGHLTTNIDLYGNVNPDDITVNVIPSGITGRGSVKVSSTEARMGGPGPC